MELAESLERRQEQIVECETNAKDDKNQADEALVRLYDTLKNLSGNIFKKYKKYIILKNR